jgi:glyoxylase-like metal-dependent hydrolase (beta-lactamase superfamily II)
MSDVGASVDRQAIVVASCFDRLGVRVLERGWLSSNNVVFRAPGSPAAIVDTGYALHAAQTVALTERLLDGAPLALIVNTHLHSDHCGGNAALQARWPEARTWVPDACFHAAREWDADRLTFTATDQRCARFRVDGALRVGDELSLGGHVWQVHGAPGHDPTALMLFEPYTRTLVSGDALWEQRLAIVFPELVGESGFDACAATLSRIEQLAPSVVIPGHGRPFTDVTGALDASRRRLAAFAADPARHRRHAVRSLVMFHMLECRRSRAVELREWLLRTPIVEAAGDGDDRIIAREAWADDVLQTLVGDGALRREPDGWLVASGA